MSLKNEADDQNLRDALTRKLELAAKIREAEAELAKLNLEAARSNSTLKDLTDFINIPCW